VGATLSGAVGSGQIGFVVNLVDGVVLDAKRQGISRHRSRSPEILWDRSFSQQAAHPQRRKYLRNSAGRLRLQALENWSHWWIWQLTG
jgi:hypothetical protein